MPELLLAAIVAFVLPVRAWRRHLRNAPPAPPAQYVAETVLLTGILAFLLWSRGVPLGGLGLPPDFSARFLIDLGISTISVLTPDWWLVHRIKRKILETAAGLAQDRVFADTLANRRTPSSFAIVAIVGAVWEELCFRGVVFLLVPRTPAGVLSGIAASSLLFGAQHLRNGRQGFAYASAYGVLFSVIYLITADLAAVMIAHAAGNMFAVFRWAPQVQRAQQEAFGPPSTPFCS